MTLKASLIHPRTYAINPPFKCHRCRGRSGGPPTIQSTHHAHARLDQGKLCTNVLSFVSQPRPKVFLRYSYREHAARRERPRPSTSRSSSHLASTRIAICAPPASADLSIPRRSASLMLSTPPFASHMPEDGNIIASTPPFSDTAPPLSPNRTATQYAGV